LQTVFQLSGSAFQLCSHMSLEPRWTKLRSFESSSQHPQILKGLLQTFANSLSNILCGTPSAAGSRSGFQFFQTYLRPPLRMCSRLVLGTPISKEKHRGSCFTPPLSGTKLSEEGLRGGVSTLSPCRMDAHWAMLPWPAPQT